MQVASYLMPSSVLLRPSCHNKWDLIKQLCEAVSVSYNCSPELSVSIREAVLAREESSSTGMDGGIAVPHAAVDGLNSLMVGMAVKPEGIDFDSIDGSMSTVIVLILVPKSQRFGHLRLMAEVARRLSDLGFQQHISAAKSEEQVVDLWT